MSRPRRSRYTVTAQRPIVGVKQHVVLAYDAHGARRYYEARGWTVIQVVKGDLVNCAPAAGGWTLDRAAFRAAVEFLGIKMPVQIKQTGHQGGRYGAHQFAPARGKFMKDARLDTASGGMIHKITVKSWLSPEQAGRTLWHELCHAMQSEQACADATTMRDQFMAWRFCSARGHGVAYNRKPIEVEARSYETFNDEKPLAR